MEIRLKFDKNSRDWYPDIATNQVFITSCLKHASMCLKVRGHYFLNELFDLLDFPRTSDGAIYGWIGPDDFYVNVDWQVTDPLNVVDLIIKPSGVIYDRI